MPRTHRPLRWLARRRAGAHHVAVVAVVLDDGDVLVAEHPFRFGAWALPGGWVHRFEDPFRAVEREVREELGIDVVAVEVVGCERQGNPAPVRPSSLTVAIRCELRTSGRPAMALRSGELRRGPLGGVGRGAGDAQRLRTSDHFPLGGRRHSVSCSGISRR